MTTTGHDPAYRVDLGKRFARYLVVVDDRDPFTSVADFYREDRIPQRRVAHVERQASHPEEREAQWDELVGSCLDAEGESLSLLTYNAVSHGHAVYRARREYAMSSAAARMAEAIDDHLERGDRGWIAIRIADGGSDGELYADAFVAQAAQEQPERWTYVPVSPLCPWSVRMCEEHLKLIADFERRCRGLVYDFDAFL
ncbi:hypothetical protein ACGF5T_33555 [Streptomyces sp. NPDC047853]|uniref:hypothetical protein n=1 Tax=unclassified Streptomyces TaxID=2593676 RepID=UPI003453A430